MKVVHVITGLDVGGAERMLAKLIEALPGRFESHVISLTDEGPMAQQMRASGATVYALGMKRRRLPTPAILVRLARVLRQLQPGVVQTWLYHADLLGGIAARWARVGALAWNIRASDLPAETSLGTRAAVRLCAASSHWLPRVVVCCSQSARVIHEGLGYDPARFVMIPNGFDLDQFRPDEGARLAVRRSFDIPLDVPLIGLIARFDLQKDHALFFSAARKLQEAYPSTHYLLAGRGVDAENIHLRALAEEAGVVQVTRLLGERSDISRITAALDVATSCSAWGEAFPNTLGEALACGVPCVTTDVGDAAMIVGQAGFSVPRGDAGALLRAWQALLAMSPEQRSLLGQQGRSRVKAEFDVRVVAQRYADLYESLVIA